jgi:Mrp family chromosome partitioning ATPase
LNTPGLKTSDAIDFWRAAHRALRGRYRAVLWVALAGCALGTALGLSLGQRLFAATGIVRIASAMPTVLRETDQNKPMAMFDGIIQAQREVMSGREVIDAAMKSEIWQRLSASRRTPTDEQFASALKVETHPRSDHLQVRFTHRDPVVAAAAVQSLIAAYKDVFTREQEQAESSRLELLRGRQSGLGADLAKLEAKIADVSGGRPLAEIEPMFTEHAEQVRRLRAALTDVQIALAGGPSLAAFPTRAEDAEPAPGTARWYAMRLDELSKDLFEAKSHGLTASHPTVMKLEAGVQMCREQMAAAPADAGEGVEPEQPRRSLHEREASLRALLQTAQGEMEHLAGAREQLKALDDQAVVLRQQLFDTTSRLDALTTEGSVGSRLMIVAGGQRPMTAALDNRVKMAAAGAVTGAMAPFALLVAWSVLRRRYRSGEELAEDLADRTPFVAVLPDIDNNGTVAALGARCVHDLRARLAPGGPSSPRVYLVTSAAPGEGASSLALSLGLSFAAAGSRTLLIDGDMAARHLTLGFNAGDRPGLVEAAAGGEPVLHRLRGGLGLLTAGQSRSQDACRLVPGSLKRLLHAFRQRFDVVLIDGDPMLTGLTASVIAPQSDGVILAVANGQRPVLVHRAARTLQSLGASLSAAVFNRADAADFPAHVREKAVATNRALPERVRRFGPLVAGVMASVSMTREEDLELARDGMELARPDEPGHEGAHGQTRDQRRDAA